MVTLRPYQNDAVFAVVQHYHDGHRAALLHLATGTGKTVIAAEIARLAKRPLLFVAHRQELLDQARDKFLQADPDAEVGYVRRECDEWDKPIMVASIQTLYRQHRLDRIPPDRYGLVVIDECHHAAADTYQTIIDYFGDAGLLGLSATPFRSDAKSLVDIFGEEPVFSYSIREGVKAG